LSALNVRSSASAWQFLFGQTEIVSERSLTEALLGLNYPARAAFATAAAERCVARAENEDSDYHDQAQPDALTMACLSAISDIWSGLAVDPSAFSRVSHAVASFYLTPLWRSNYVDEPSKASEAGGQVHVQSALYAALTFLHGSADLAARAALNANQFGSGERERQPRDLAFLQTRGDALLLDPTGSTGDERAAARNIIDDLRAGT